MMGMASGTVKTLKKGMLATLDRIASRQTALVVVEFEERWSVEVIAERIKQVEGVLWAERASTTELERAKMRENQALMRLAEAQAYIKTLEEALDERPSASKAKTPEQMGQKWVTPREAALKVGVSFSSIHRAIHDGRIQFRERHVNVRSMYEVIAESYRPRKGRARK